MRISDWSSDVCSSDLEFADVGADARHRVGDQHDAVLALGAHREAHDGGMQMDVVDDQPAIAVRIERRPDRAGIAVMQRRHRVEQMGERSEEHTSEIQSLMRISYAVFGLKTKTTHNHITNK